MANDQTPNAPEGAVSPPDTASAFGAQQQRAAVAAQLPDNTVQVDPGGATFSTITEALNSINDAGPQKQYLVTAGPGFYNEQVVLKPYVTLQGAGANLTSVNYPPQAGNNSFSRGAIVAASNSGVYDLTATCYGGTWGDYSTALMVGGCSPFSCSGVALVCDDQGNAGINIETVAVNWNTGTPGPSEVYFYYSTARALANNGESVAVCMIANGPATVLAMESKFYGYGGVQSYGVQSNGGANVTLDECYAQGATFALSIPDGASTLVANACQIDGPVGNGVKVNNYTPPSK